LQDIFFSYIYDYIIFLYFPLKNRQARVETPTWRSVVLNQSRGLDPNVTGVDDDAGVGDVLHQHDAVLAVVGHDRDDHALLHGDRHAVLIAGVVADTRQSGHILLGTDTAELVHGDVGDRDLAVALAADRGHGDTDMVEAEEQIRFFAESRDVGLRPRLVRLALHQGVDRTLIREQGGIGVEFILFRRHDCLTETVLVSSHSYHVLSLHRQIPRVL